MKGLILFIFLILFIIFYNEFLIYYIVIFQCNWPGKLEQPVKAMLIADTHLLGPVRGHWFDKLRREWQMHRAYQTAIQIYRPQIIFILGDVFDEGDIVSNSYFNEYVQRYHQLFHTRSNVKVYSVVGNHDIGFHYRLHPILMDRFKKAFNRTGNALITFKNVHFVQINSMTMTRDGCNFCYESELQLLNLAKRFECAKNTSSYHDCESLSRKLKSYSRPVILQHFPTYRTSDEECIESDAPLFEKYRENWEVLSKDGTSFVGQLLNPRVAFSGHSHHYCRINNSLGIEEFTLASFSWRNKRNPSFLLVEFTPEDYAVSKCDMPSEVTVIVIYVITISINLFLFFRFLFIKLRARPKCSQKNN